MFTIDMCLQEWMARKFKPAGEYGSGSAGAGAIGGGNWHSVISFPAVCPVYSAHPPSPDLLLDLL